MKIRIIKLWNRIFLDLNEDQETFTSILALSKNGITKNYVPGSFPLPMAGQYIADEDSD